MIKRPTVAPRIHTETVASPLDQDRRPTRHLTPRQHTVCKTAALMLVVATTGACASANSTGSTCPKGQVDVSNFTATEIVNTTGPLDVATLIGRNNKTNNGSSQKAEWKQVSEDLDTQLLESGDEPPLNVLMVISATVQYDGKTLTKSGAVTEAGELTDAASIYGTYQTVLNGPIRDYVSSDSIRAFTSVGTTGEAILTAEPLDNCVQVLPSGYIVTNQS